jgi:hypothetical protein
MVECDGFKFVVPRLNLNIVLDIIYISHVGYDYVMIHTFPKGYLSKQFSY